MTAVAVVGLCLSIAAYLLTPLIAVAQGDIYEGLDQEVVDIGQAIDRADTTDILGALSSVRIVRTAYPGDGIEVSRAAAVSEIPILIFSRPQFADEFGSGAFRLLGLWIPNIDKLSVLLIGSGIDGGGVRRSLIFTARIEQGRWAIVAYGHVMDTAATLAQFESQGDLRLAPKTQIAAAPPSTGNRGRQEDTSRPVFMVPILAAVVALAILGLAAYMQWQRQR